MGSNPRREWAERLSEALDQPCPEHVFGAPIKLRKCIDNCPHRPTPGNYHSHPAAGAVWDCDVPGLRIRRRPASP